ncbi:hypothetical protein VDGD_05370 [Verticillium dahliae]|nr:DNA mismatch repair protein MSH3 [Verticillium dahliae VDG1]RBQ76241.1 hypothetical protein VDGD_05370 [Verticillium dahliae]
MATPLTPRPKLEPGSRSSTDSDSTTTIPQFAVPPRPVSPRNSAPTFAPQEEVQHRSSEWHTAQSSTNWPPQSVAQSFMRSDAPTPTVFQTRTSTVDGSEPVYLEVRNRGMPYDQSTPGLGESFLEGSFQNVGAKLKACNDTLGDVQQLGIEHIVSLPSLIMVGDQSAGKSMLMSSVAGLPLPRSDGVCTRCPIHIRASRNNEWSCRVSLQLDYDYCPPPFGQPITKEDVTAENPFPPWVRRQNREVKEFMTIYSRNKSEIETVLRWAQVAVLNYAQNSDLFIPGSGAIARTRELAVEAENTIAKFSPNTVALEIKGPDLPDLSFYDLPGIFRNSGYEEDEYLVQVVENLAVQHISENDALIIWAVPMNADPETSSTLSIIRRVGAQKRTIGVMTKADLLPNQGSNSYGQWLSMLRGERHLIGHEYFITSRRAEQDLDRQTQWEEALFNGKHENWPEEFAEFSDRCGVERLKEALSEKLGKEFAKNLPSIKSKIFDELRKNEKRLSNLPELPTNIEYEVRKSLIEFTAIVKDKIRGNEFSSAFGLLAGSFRECLLHAKPKFSLKHKSDVPVLEISDDDEPASASRKRGPQASSNGASKRPRHVGSSGSFSQASQAGLQMKTEEATVPNGTPTPHTPSRGSVRPSVLPAPFQNFTSLGSGFRSIGAIRADIQAKTKAGMPNIVPSEVYNDLCKLAVKHWNHPMLVFLEAVMSHLQVIVNQALDQAFGKLKRRLVFKDSKRHMEAFLSSRRSKALEFLTELYEMESYQLFTINHDAFTLYEQEEGRLLKRYRHYVRWQAFVGEKCESSDKTAASHFNSDWDRMTPDQRASEQRRHDAELIKMGPDPFEKELKVAAYVRGYYRLAALRFAETTTLYVTSRMFPSIVKELDMYLETQLGLMGAGPEAFDRLMDEEETTARKRQTCKLTVEKLKKAMDSINELERETEDVDMAMDGANDMGGLDDGGHGIRGYAETISDEL